MRYVLACLLLGVMGCQGAGCPGVAPRFAVSKVTRARTANDVTTTRIHELTYSDALTLAGRELESGRFERSSTNGNDSRDADLTFEYDQGRLTRVDQRSEHDELDATTDYLYTDRDQLKKVEIDSGEGGIVDVDIECFYDDGGRLEMLTYSWAWWILRENERADVTYSDDGYIRDLDGDDVFVRFTWEEGLLERVEVQRDGSGDDPDYRLSYQDGRLERVEDDDDDWSLTYDDAGRLQRIDADAGGYEETVEYEYTDGSLQGVRVAPRLPLFVNWVIGLDGRPLTDIDVLALPDYFTD